jgi:hypothetical protein
MLNYFDLDLFNEPFHRNLEDWCLGGPRKLGYTRAGPMMFFDSEIHLSSYRRQMIKTDDVLAKNRNELDRWHLSFLQGGVADMQSPYYLEYLLPRYGPKKSIDRMSDVIELFHSMKNGFNARYPVWVADLKNLELGFRYFRFDGAHRACCAKICGIEELPSYVFTIKGGS